MGLCGSVPYCYIVKKLIETRRVESKDRSVTESLVACCVQSTLLSTCF